MMVHPHLAAEARRALIAWRHLQLRHGQALPDGWDALVELYAAAARAHLPDSVPDLLTLEEAADRARVSTSTLYRWRRDGLPEQRIRGRVLIARTDLDRWVRSPANRPPVSVGHRAA
jgi:excisionase family DNA binding protein